MMDPHDVAALVGLSEALVGHPHLAHLREQVNRELYEANREAGEHLKKIKEEAQAAEDQAQSTKSRIADELARVHQEGKPTPVRNTYDGMPGPAEPSGDLPSSEDLVAPKSIPSAPAQPDLPNVDRRL